MGRRPRSSQPRSFSGYSFAFLGFHDGWYVLEADMRAPQGHLDAVAFEARVTTWLVTNRITPGIWSHFGSGNTGDYPLVFNEDGSALNLLLKRPADVLRLSAVFPCTGITVDALHAAVQAEADVHIFILDDLARIAHEAIRSLSLAFGEYYPSWADLGGETRVAFTLQVKRCFDHPEETVETIHQTWVEQRVRDGWKLAARFSQDRLTDPLLLPWRRLSERVQARYRLLQATVAALAPMLKT
jgi:hypothetical protein